MPVDLRPDKVRPLAGEKEHRLGRCLEILVRMRLERILQRELPDLLWVLSKGLGLQPPLLVGASRPCVGAGVVAGAAAILAALSISLT